MTTATFSMSIELYRDTFIEWINSCITLEQLNVCRSASRSMLPENFKVYDNLDDILKNIDDAIDARMASIGAQKSLLV